MKFDVAELIKRVGVFRRPELVLPEFQPTVAQRKELQRVYMTVVRAWAKTWRETLRPEYERSLSELITDDADSLQTQIGLSQRQIETVAAAAGVSTQEWIRRVEIWHRRRFAQAFTPAGVDLSTLLGLDDVAAPLRAVLAENISLIRSLNEQLRNDLSGHIFRGLQNRSPSREVAREINRSLGIARKRAELIASDQLQKLTGRLDQERQEQAGIRKFKWAHSGKLNPRDHHLERDGKVFAWSSKVAREDPPGRAIRCGCRARAVVDF